MTLVVSSRRRRRRRRVESLIILPNIKMMTICSLSCLFYCDDACLDI